MSHLSNTQRHEMKDSVIHGKTQTNALLLNSSMLTDSDTAAQPCHSLPAPRALQKPKALLFVDTNI